ncbi:hypothetical protein [Ferrimonas sediminicola]|nr:hypothetical protein [Ferrimonas sediminicola]
MFMMFLGSLVHRLAAVPVCLPDKGKGCAIPKSLYFVTIWD